MVRKNPPQNPQPAQLTAETMRAAIPKLKRRIEEVNSFDPDSINDRSDPRPDSIEQKIGDTLVEILGADTLDYHRFRVGSLDRAPIVMGGIPLHELRKGYDRGKADAISKLQTLVELFEEKLADLGETKTGRAPRTFSGLDLHPEVKRAVEGLFSDGHYANAVEDACKVLDLLVRMRSGRMDLSGTDLMHTIFSPKSPILKFSDLSTDSDESEQHGMMYLYAGVMLAFRNPRAHALINDDAEEALDIISLVSFLAKALDGAKK